MYFRNKSMEYSDFWNTDQSILIELSIKMLLFGTLFDS